MEIYIEVADGPSPLYRKATGTALSLHPRPADVITGLSVWDDKRAMWQHLVQLARSGAAKPPKPSDRVTVLGTKDLHGIGLVKDPAIPHHWFLRPIHGSIADWVASDPESPQSLTAAIKGATLRTERFDA